MMEKHTEIFEQYSKGTAYKNSIGLFETVKQNENFFVGRQWERVQANGLPTPVFNFIQRVVMFLISSTMSDSVAMTASAIDEGETKDGGECAEAINLEFAKVFERCDILSKLRLFLRNAAVDGDGCLYLRYDPDSSKSGGIEAEIIDNTRVFFGNPNECEVERQPYIIISSYEYIDDLKRMIIRNGGSGEEANRLEGGGQADPLGAERAVLLLRLRKDPLTGHVMACEATENLVIREEWDTGLTRYPIIWMNWERVKDCCHGQAAVSGLIPNQIFVNKLFAMAMISMMSTAYPKVVYDSTRIASWDNRVGTAVPVAGGDVSGVAAIINPAQISPQVHEFIDSAISYTRDFMGATDASLGLVRADNTSAILALQRASQVPLELVRQELFQRVEDMGHIIIDICAAYLGKRSVKGKMFDFSRLHELPFVIRLDVGASSYWSEVAAMQSLDNLMNRGLISLKDYLERVPAGMIPRKEELIEAMAAAVPGGAGLDAAGFGGL